MKNKKLFAFLTLLFVAVPLACSLAAGIVIPDGTGLPEPSPITGQGPVVDVVANVLMWILNVFLLLAIIGFTLTGIQYILAMGSSYGVEKAKNNFVYSIIAVSVVGGAYIILYTIHMLLL
jgi:hypothetical protein